MKKTLKLLLLTTLVIFLGCAKDEFEEPIINNNRIITIEEVSLSNVLCQNSKISGCIKKFNKKREDANRNNKLVFNSIFNFYYDDENGYYLKEGEYESYTFKVIKPVESSLELENIIFSKNKDGNFDVYFYNYHFTAEEFINMTVGELAAKGFDVWKSEFDFETGMYRTPSEEVNDPCDDTEWIEVSQSPRYFKALAVDPCGEIASSGSGSSSGTTSSSSQGENGTTSSGSQTTTATNGTTGYTGVVTVPNPGGAMANPCKRVSKQFLKYQGMRNALINLATTTSQNYENGIFIDDTATESTQNPVQNLTTTGITGGSVNLPNLPSPKKYTMIAHTHDKSGSNGQGTFSIFSWGDLNRIAALIKANQIDTNNFVFYCITADNTRYALTIDNPTEFSNYFDVTTDMNDPSNTRFMDGAKAIKLDKMENKYYSNQNLTNHITRSSNIEDDKKLFLQMIKEIGGGVTLFEVNTTFDTFTKLNLSGLNNTVTPSTPCN